MTPDTPLDQAVRILPAQKKALAKLGIVTIRDLLYHFPARYGETLAIQPISSLKKGDSAVIYGKVSKLKTVKAWVKKIPMSEATIEDTTGHIKVIWFHQPYIAKMIPEDSLVKAEGKVSERKGELYLSNPEIENVGNLPDIGVGGASLFGDAVKNFGYPVYPESRGVTSRWIYHAIQKIFKTGILADLVDPIPKEVLERYSLPPLDKALIWMHAPQQEDHSIAARKRFAFEEVFFIQVEKQRERMKIHNKPSFSIFPTEKNMGDFISRFPFAPTLAQAKAINDILKDFKKGYAMSRLLEGDVGSGKTAVAASTVYAVTTTRPAGKDFGRLQTAYMAPTEILATQHFESFIQYFAYLGINIGLITGSGCKKFPSKINPKIATDISRTQLLKWVENGEIPILIGTHALIEKKVKFKNLAYIIIDEQHRFGTNQRFKLRKKDDILPHLLSMTATPIPRTLALTIFGDLDLTLLDEMPPGRKQVITEIVLPSERNKVYDKIKAEIKNGRQAYVICPRIDEPDPNKENAVNAKSVIEEAARLKRDIFKTQTIGVLHGKMTPAKKDEVMLNFKDGKIDILVATSVVEVGVNVPNATSIIIEGAERFGLAQLHQLRGRVIRSNHQAYCYVFTESKSDKTFDRLKALSTAKNGFELAEFDMAQRGTGELYGRKQWGISDVAMEAIKNIKMVEAARTEAEYLLKSDPALLRHPLIKERIEKIRELMHPE